MENLRDYNKCPGEGWTWISICSGHAPRADGAHYWPDPECSRCMVGHWNNDKEREEDHKLHDTDYEAWFRKHNAPDSESRKFLEEVLPRLKYVVRFLE